MRISKHEAGDGGRCRHCGAAQQQYGGWGERTCIDRDDGATSSGLRPEPTLRRVACEDTDAISVRLKDLEKERLAIL